jgi:hypothetical protein
MRALALGHRVDGDHAAGNGSAERPTRSGPKWIAGGVGALLLLAVLWPVVQNWRTPPRDSFPLSYYPMFTLERAETTRVTHLAGFDVEGNRYLIPYASVGPGGLNQVRRQINRIVERGDADDLCRSVARRIARNNREATTNIVALEVVSGTYSLTDYFTGNQIPAVERVHATCRVRPDTS